jgi:hypothetical protein
MGSVPVCLVRARVASRRLISARAADLTSGGRIGKFAGLPRDFWPVAGGCGVRPMLENSTACQKSMPNPRRGLGVSGVCLVCLVLTEIPLV